MNRAVELNYFHNLTVFNLLAGLITYTWQPNKPALYLSAAELAQLPAVI